MPDVTTVDAGTFRRVAFLGGVYSNYLALQEALRLARARGVDALFALGDFGAFGPHPDRTVEILRDEGIPAIQGNYEESLSSAAEDCHCGYTDPRDNHFAADQLRLHPRPDRGRAQALDGHAARPHPAAPGLAAGPALPRLAPDASTSSCGAA